VQVRTSARDGGGAYLLLDGSRAMTDDLDMGANQVYMHPYGGRIRPGISGQEGIMIRDEPDVGFGVLWSGSLWLYTILGFRSASAYIRTHYDLPIKSWDGSTYNDVATLVTGAGYRLDLIRVGGGNLPVVDPADGYNRLWNNGGVVTVGT